MRPSRLAAVVLSALVLLLPLLAGCSKKDGKALPAPNPGSTTTTTEPPDLTQVPLEPIAVTGKPTSTTRPLGGGKATIAGRVVDTDGAPVAGAFVRALYYGDPNKPEVIEALSLADGTYRFDQVLGGRWRIRAWRTPELATLEDSTFFLGYSENRQVDLKVKAATDYVVTSSLAPNPPFTGSAVELAVLVMSQAVDDEGVIHRTPVGGAAVTLNIIGRWYLGTDATKATEATGRAAWTITCVEEGAQPITAVVGGKDWPLSIPACLDPASTSTTTATTLPPGASTTSSTKPKSSTTTSSTRPKSYATTSTRPAGHY
jgi:hypothetical protein